MTDSSVFDALVDGLTSSGQGVVRHPSGLAVFVSSVWLGERVSVRIVEFRQRFALGELVEVLDASEHRRASPCEYHGASPNHCGGCAWMFIDYQAQLEAKQNKVEQAIERIEKKWLKNVQPIIGSENELGYRNRVQFKSDGEKLGFVGPQSHNLVNVDDCVVLVSSLRKMLKKLADKLPNTNWAPNKKQKWVTLDIDDQLNEGDASLNSRLPFKQANDAQNERMKEWLRVNVEKLITQDADLKTVIELFCGSGNFTDVLSDFPLNIIAAECNEEAVSAINSRNQNHVQAKLIDLFHEAKFEHFIQKNPRADILVLDPPRDGLKINKGLFSKAKTPKHVLYISCDLATFGRDLAVFQTQGYKLRNLQPIDLFPNTPHVELMAHLKR